MPNPTSASPLEHEVDAADGGAAQARALILPNVNPATLHQVFVERKTLRPEDMKAYLDAANTRGLLPMFYLALVSGLRKGELVALLCGFIGIRTYNVKIISSNTLYLYAIAVYNLCI